MATITELLSQLQTDRDNLANNLTIKGVSASNTETFTSLVPKVLDISDGIDTSDATATSLDILKDKTAYVNGVKLTGEIENLVETEYTPTIENQIISSGLYLSGPQTIKGDPNLLASNIKEGVSIFGVSGSYSGGSSPVKKETLINTSAFTTKQETLDNYGTSIYINESTYEAGLSTLSDTVARWGGISSTNNYIGDSSLKYGINVANWSEASTTTTATGILFFTPVDLVSGTLLLSLNCYCASWMNPTLKIHLISAVGNTEAEIIAAIQDKITAENYDLTKSFTFAGSSSLTDVFVEIKNSVAGTYYIYIDGTVKADNSNFTYINLGYINF